MPGEPVSTSMLLKLAAQIGIPLARNFFGGKDIERAQREAGEENRRAASMSNLINAFSPQAQHRPHITQPQLRQSGISRVLGAAETGLNAFNMFQGLKSQEVARQLQEQRLADTQEAATARRGMDAATLSNFKFPGTPKSLEGADPVESFFPKGLASDIGRAAFIRQGRDDKTRTRNMLRQQASDDLNRRAVESEISLRGAQEVKARAEAPKKPRALEQIIKIAAGKGLSAPGLSQDEFFDLVDVRAIENESGAFSAVERGNLWAAYRQAEQGRQEQLDDKAIERIDAFHDQARRDPVIGERAEISRAFLLGLQGLEVGNGFGDIQAMKMLARVQDPNSVVRQEEFNTLMEALGFAEQTELRLTNKFWEGEQLNERGRQAVFELLQGAYDQRGKQMQEVARTIADASIALPGMEQHKALFDDAISVYALPVMPKDLISSAKLKVFGAPKAASPTRASTQPDPASDFALTRALMLMGAPAQ